MLNTIAWLVSFLFKPVANNAEMPQLINWWVNNDKLQNSNQYWVSIAYMNRFKYT